MRHAPILGFKVLYTEYIHELGLGGFLLLFAHY